MAAAQQCRGCLAGSSAGVQRCVGAWEGCLRVHGLGAEPGRLCALIEMRRGVRGTCQERPRLCMEVGVMALKGALKEVVRMHTERPSGKCHI